jgi:hypothetical protein
MTGGTMKRCTACMWEEMCTTAKGEKFMMGSKKRKITTKYIKDNPTNASPHPDMHTKREKIQPERRNASHYLQ